ncbi:MAG: Uma2 family endonuclease [Isosphaeraceae bacterium]
MLSSTTATSSVPPRLESGDHLTADEFLRLYGAIPGLEKAELIDGVVYLPSPTRWTLHAVQDNAFGAFLGVYWSRTPGVQSGHSGTLRLDDANVPQPDHSLIILPSHGGRAEIGGDGYISGAPELACEISASTRSIDLNAKFRLYLRSGIREYVVWRVEDDAIDWFVERQGRYERLPADDAGILRSEVFPGLWLDTRAMLRLDLGQVLRVLEQGLATPGHAEFVDRLARQAGRATQPG